MYPGITPELEKEVDQLIEWLRSQVTTSGSSLPWLRHGLKGLLNKVWYGDAPENPSWQIPDHIKGRPTLAEYIARQESMEARLDAFLGENNNSNHMVESILKEFKHKFMSILSQYMVNGKMTAEEEWPDGVGRTEEEIAQGIHKELPAAKEILKKLGHNASDVSKFDAATLAQELAREGSLPPHIKYAVGNPMHHAGFHQLFMRSFKNEGY